MFGMAAISAPTTPPTTCAAPPTRSAGVVRRARLRPGGAADDRGAACQPLRRGHRTLTFTARQAAAFELVRHYSDFFSDPTTQHGLRPDAITDRTELRQLTAFFAWTAWAAAANRPGHDYSYTNNWPPEPRVDNAPTANVIVWSVAVADPYTRQDRDLFGAFGRWGRNLGWQGRERGDRSRSALPGDVALTPAQRATAWFFFVMAALFLLQTVFGAASQHRADIGSFFGIDLAQAFPYNLMRTWHVQLAIFWVATSFVAAGIFLAPMIARQSHAARGKLAFALLVALAVVVFGTLIGSFLGITACSDTASNWFGLQGFEYLDLARLWQVLLSIQPHDLGRDALARAAPAATGEHVGNMPWLFFLAACAIPAFYAVGLIARTGDNHHHRVLALGRRPLGGGLPRAVRCRDGRLHVRPARGRPRAGRAWAVVFLDIILYSGRRRDPGRAPPLLLRRACQHMALGAFFSAAEVIPLTFLTVEAWSFLQLGAAQVCSQTPFPHRWAVMFLVAVWLLELPRRRHLRLPDQPAGRLLLRDRHRPDRQPRARGDDGRLRDDARAPGWRCSACAT